MLWLTTLLATVDPSLEASGAGWDHWIALVLGQGGALVVAVTVGVALWLKLDRTEKELDRVNGIFQEIARKAMDH